MLGTYLDNGFYLITRKQALTLGGGTLPSIGKERLVVHDGKWYWLARTMHRHQVEWTIRDAKGWHLVNGIATLGD